MGRRKPNSTMELEEILKYNFTQHGYLLLVLKSLLTVYRKKKTNLQISFEMKLLRSFKTNLNAHCIKATKTTGRS